MLLLLYKIIVVDIMKQQLLIYLPQELVKKLRQVRKEEGIPISKQLELAYLKSKGVKDD